MSVNLYCKKVGGYILKGQYTVKSITQTMINLQKEPAGYIEAISIVDLRTRIYRITDSSDNEIKFPALPDIKKIEKDKIEKELEEYRKTIGRSCYKSMMKKKGDCEDMKIREEIQKRLSEGKDIDTIVDELVAEGNDKRVVTRLAVKFGYQSKKNKKEQQEQIHEVIKAAVQEEKQQEVHTVPDESKRKITFRRMYESIQGNYKYDIDYSKKVITLERCGNAKIKFDELYKLLQDLNTLNELIEAGGQDA